MLVLILLSFIASGLCNENYLIVDIQNVSNSSFNICYKCYQSELENTEEIPMQGNWRKKASFKNIKFQQDKEDFLEFSIECLPISLEFISQYSSKLACVKEQKEIREDGYWNTLLVEKECDSPCLIYNYKNNDIAYRTKINFSVIPFKDLAFLHKLGVDYGLEIGLRQLKLSLSLEFMFWQHFPVFQCLTHTSNEPESEISVFPSVYEQEQYIYSNFKAAINQVMYKNGYRDLNIVALNLDLNDNPELTCALAEMFEKGDETEVNEKQAKILYLQSFKTGYDLAYLKYCRMKVGFNIIESSINLAINHYNISIELEYIRKLEQKAHGSTIAKFFLGFIYSQGIGTEIDIYKAVNYYRQAAYKGLAPAQYNLSILYKEGRGVNQSISKTRKWCKASASQGFFKAKSMLDILDNKIIKIGRNQLCPCQSGIKYKKCCFIISETYDIID